MAELIAACMEADPGDRPSAREIVDMLAATGNESALQSAAARRKKARAEARPPPPPLPPCAFLQQTPQMRLHAAHVHTRGLPYSLGQSTGIVPVKAALLSPGTPQPVCPSCDDPGV